MPIFLLFGSAVVFFDGAFSLWVSLSLVEKLHYKSKIKNSSVFALVAVWIFFFDETVGYETNIVYFHSSSKIENILLYKILL